MAAVGKLTRIWRSFASEFQLYKSLVISILLCGCEILTLAAVSEESSLAFEAKCLRKLLRISHLEQQ